MEAKGEILSKTKEVTSRKAGKGTLYCMGVKLENDTWYGYSSFKKEETEKVFAALEVGMKVELLEVEVVERGDNTYHNFKDYRRDGKPEDAKLADVDPLSKEDKITLNFKKAKALVQKSYNMSLKETEEKMMTHEAAAKQVIAVFMALNGR